MWPSFGPGFSLAGAWAAGGGGGGVFRVVTQPTAMRKQNPAVMAIKPMFFNFKWRMMNCTASTHYN